MAETAEERRARWASIRAKAQQSLDEKPNGGGPLNRASNGQNGRNGTEDIHMKTGPTRKDITSLKVKQTPLQEKEKEIAVDISHLHRFGYTGINESKPKAEQDEDYFDMFAEEQPDNPTNIQKKGTKSSLKRKVDEVEAVETPDLKLHKKLDANLKENFDDKQGYLKTTVGQVLNGRYAIREITRKAGTFGSVVSANDNITSAVVVIKIVRQGDAFAKIAKKETDALMQLRAKDPRSRWVIAIHESFNEGGHACIVTEAMWGDLRKLVEVYGRRDGLDYSAVRIYSHQLIQAVRFMHAQGLVHADIKPDNILVSSDERDGHKTIKVCDFGNVETEERIHGPNPMAASPFYRAPEVMFGCRMTRAFDIWSVGCTIFELYTSKQPFQGRNNNDMLFLIQQCRGRFSNKALRRAEDPTIREEHFRYKEPWSTFIRYTDTVGAYREMEFASSGAKDMDLRSRLDAATAKDAPHRHEHIRDLTALLDACLRLDPFGRITADKALGLAFFTGLQSE